MSKLSEKFPKGDKMSFVDWSMQRGGRLFPITFSSHLIQGRSFMNPSILVLSANNALLVLRSGDYRYLRPTNHLKSLTSTGAIQYLYFDKNGTTEPLLISKVSLKVSEGSRVVPIKVTQQFQVELQIDRNLRASTIEDLRISRVDDLIVMLGNIELSSGERRPVLLTSELPKQDQEKIRLQCEVVIDYGGLQQVEKNWVPIESERDKFVRFPFPVQLSSRNKLLSKEKLSFEMFQSNCESMTGLLGSTPLARFREGYLAVVHSKTLGSRKNNHRYWHRCLYYDKNFRVEKVSQPFSFLGYETEFCTGLSIYKNRAYFSFCCNDGLNFILVVDSLKIFSKYLKAISTQK